MPIIFPPPGIRIRINGGLFFKRRRQVNLIEGTGVSLAAADDPTSGETDVIITATGAGAGHNILSGDHADSASADIPANGEVLTFVTGAPSQWKAEAAATHGNHPAAGVVGGQIDIGDAASNGASGDFARADHQHAFPAPATGYPADVDFAAEADGVATTPARSDHKHTLSAPAAPADVTKAAAAAGTSNNPARQDHKHDVSTASPAGAIDIGDAASEGTATSLARSDHQHQVSAPVAGYPVDVSPTEADGTATTPARSDHGHTLANPYDGAVVIDGASASLEVPNAAGGRTVDAAGEVTVDTTPTPGHLNFHDGTAERALDPQFSKAITIESPTSTEDIIFFHTEKAITIRIMRAVVRGTTPSVTWTVRHSTDRSAVGNEVVTGGTVTTSTTTGSDVTIFNDATIPADSWVWVETTAQSGTVNEIGITIHATVDP
ncbi:MAG: hypothetical protein L0177_12045 [Chloroflexi bacterium]|nr:hypothetical protein [Chloroflexota bacterium]